MYVSDDFCTPLKKKRRSAQALSDAEATESGNLENLLEDRHICHELVRSVQLVVRIQRSDTLSTRLSGVRVNGTKEKMTEYADKINLLKM